MTNERTVEQKRRLGWFPVNAIVPPFVGVEMVDYRDRIELTPHYWCREFVALGKQDADPFISRIGGFFHSLAKHAMGGRKIWVITSWRLYEDGREEELLTRLCDPDTTAEEAQREFERSCRFLNHSREEMMDLTRLFKATPEDIAYAESRPSQQISQPVSARPIPERDLHSARMLVMEDLQPKTVELLRRAELAENSAVRGKFERDAVHALFADLSHYWSEETVLKWQQSNPPGLDWIAYFNQVRNGKKKELEPVNHELALNWLRKAYNLLTAEELSAAIYAVTGKKMKPDTIKKRRERLGLVTDRQPGPKPNSEQ